MTIVPIEEDEHGWIAFLTPQDMFLIYRALRLVEYDHGCRKKAAIPNRAGLTYLFDKISQTTPPEATFHEAP
jgi:hypothetical protein